MKVDQFWESVNRTDDGCWEWQRSRLPKGYGHGRFGRRHIYAHRIAWELANGQAVPDGLCVLHRCDNPPCCNPEHLFVGTHLDNAQDRDRKGRKAPVPKGEAHGLHKLTDHGVREIRALRAAGVPFQRIADQFGVHERTVIKVVRNETWSHVR